MDQRFKLVLYVKASGTIIQMPSSADHNLTINEAIYMQALYNKKKKDGSRVLIDIED